MKVVFVCTGNTCRSPFAEAVARRERPDLDVSSGGVAAFEGAYCPTEAVAAAAGLGLDLSGHRARALDAETIGGADLVVAMDRQHVQAVGALGGGEKTRLLADVPILDPFGCDQHEYRVRYREIERAVKVLLAGLDTPQTTHPTQGGEEDPPATRCERTAEGVTRLGRK